MVIGEVVSERSGGVTMFGSLWNVERLVVVTEGGEVGLLSLSVGDWVWCWPMVVGGSVEAVGVGGPPICVQYAHIHRARSLSHARLARHPLPDVAVPQR